MLLTVGQLAQCAGVGVATIRFYERRGLLDAPQRRASGYRGYPVDSIWRVRFIRQAQALGFSLRAIAELLALSADPASSGAAVRKKAAEKLADIDSKLVSLTRMRQVLIDLMEACPGDGPADTCPILSALDEGHDDAR